MRFRKLLLGTVAVSALGVSAGVANAGPERHGWYVGLEGAWVHVNDTSLPGASFEFENRWGALATVGHSFDHHVRFEIELGYRNNDLAQVNNVNVTDGDITNWTLMGNLIYDAPIGERWLINLGVGAGVDKVRFDREIPTVEDADATLAAQGLVGLTHRLSPHWDVALTYRYLWADDPDLFNGDMDVTKHTLSLGFRYGYDDPPPPPAPPAPPPPPPPPQAAPAQFVIFFGFNKCNITAEADAVLSEAAQAAKTRGSASVRIVGHTDTVGGNAYNQKLSECRANAAKANLVGKGVAEGSISASGKGEAELMVQTGDGVKEPQNRRATVDLQ